MPRSPAAPWTKEAGDRLAALRDKAGLTQRELAAQVGRESNYLSKIERAERPPSRKLRRQLAEALATTVEFLESGSAPDRWTDYDPRYPNLARAAAILREEGEVDEPFLVDAMETRLQSTNDRLVTEWLDMLRAEWRAWKRSKQRLAQDVDTGPPPEIAEEIRRAKKGRT